MAEYKKPTPTKKGEAKSIAPLASKEKSVSETKTESLEVKKDADILKSREEEVGELLSGDQAEALEALRDIDGFELTKDQKKALEIIKYEKNKKRELEQRENIKKQKLTTKPDIVKDDKNVEVKVYNPITNELYNTVSCPCGHLPVMDIVPNGKSSKVLKCERDEFGIKKFVSPINVKNHQIASRSPVVGDKWLCDGQFSNCEQDGFKWDTLHVVLVERNKTEVLSSFLSSEVSQLSCYIPSSTLLSYDEDVFVTEEMFNSKFGQVYGDGQWEKVNFNDPDAFFGDLPLFKSKVKAEAYDAYYNSGRYSTPVKEYTDGEITSYIPGQINPKSRTITNCFIGEHDLLTLSLKNNWRTNSYNSSRNKIQIGKNGDTLSVIIKGKKPIYSIEVTDSSGHSILEKEIKNFKQVDNRHVIPIRFPKLLSGKKSEVYDFKLIPSANIEYDVRKFKYGTPTVKAGIIVGKIWQYADPVLTLTALTDSIITGSFSQTSVDVTGKPRSSRDFESKTHTTNLNVSSGNLYLKNDVELNLSTLIKATGENNVSTRYKSGEKGFPTCVSEIAVEHGTANLEVGMTLKGEVEITKTIMKKVVGEQKPAYDQEVQYNASTRVAVADDALSAVYDVQSTEDLFPGMLVTGENVSTELISIDSEKQVTLGRSYDLIKDTTLRFSHISSARIAEIKGEQLISVSPCIELPNQAVLTFESGVKSRLYGSVTVDNSGSSTMVVTSTIDDVLFGQADETFSLSIGDFITTKPNANNYYIEVAKNSFSYINFISTDNDQNRFSKTVNILSNNIGDLTNTDNSWYKKYTPTPNYTGKDRIRFTVSDGTNSSDEKSIFITVK